MFCTECGTKLEEPGTPCPKCGALPPSSTRPTVGEPTRVDGDPMIGRVLEGKYEIEGRLGAGGMGTVYRAKRLLIGDVVAVKLLAPQQLADPKAIERFRREAQAAARLRHPNAVAVYDFGISNDGLAFLVMELVDGQSLRSLILRQGGPLELPFVADVLDQVSAALDEAHHQNIVHRDVKPENIMVDTSADPIRVKVLDFGIARMRDLSGLTLTQPNAVIGTPTYMSPEQCQAQDLDGRSDIYSLGIVAFEMLTGKVPFEAKTTTAVALQQVNQPPPRLGQFNPYIPPAVESVVMKALAKRREGRPPSAKAFANEFRAAVEPPPPVTDGRPRRPRWALIAVGVAAVAAIVVAGSLAFRHGSQKPAPPKTVKNPPPKVSSPPSIQASAATNQISLGQQVVLHWDAQHSTRVILAYAGRQIPVSASGEYRITPKQAGAGEADFTAVGAQGERATSQVDFQVLPRAVAVQKPPLIQASTASPQVRLGRPVALQWSSTNATRVVLEYAGRQFPVPLSGQYQIQPSQAGPGEAEFMAFGAGGKQATAQVAFQVMAPTPPRAVAPAIQASAVNGQVQLGQEVTLEWNAKNAQRVILKYAGKQAFEPPSGQFNILPSQVGSGEADFVAMGAGGQQATAQVNFQVMPRARPVVMVLPPALRPYNIPSQQVVTALTDRLMAEGYDVHSTPPFVNSVFAADRLPVSARPDYVVHLGLTISPEPMKRSKTTNVIGLFVKNGPVLYDAKVDCSATIQMTRVSDGQIVAQGQSSQSPSRTNIQASQYNQTVSDLSQRGLQEVLQGVLQQLPPPKSH